MTLLHISDTHTLHEQIPNTVLALADVIVHSGDTTHGFDDRKNMETEHNKKKFIEFLEWFSSTTKKETRKILSPGNHDLFIARKTKEARKLCESYGVELLIEESTEVGGKLLYASPYVPTFGEWVFMKSRGNIHKAWQKIPEDVEILVTHGPPKGILDLAIDKETSRVKQVGCSSLTNKVNNLKKLRLHLFGHVHDNLGCLNQGVFVRAGVIFANSACKSHRGDRYKLTHFGNLFPLNSL